MLYNLKQKLIVGAIAVLALAGYASAAPIFEEPPSDTATNEEQNHLFSDAITGACVEAMALGGWTGADYPECAVHNYKFTPFTKEYNPLPSSKLNFH
jgi:hypothetical protein